MGEVLDLLLATTDPLTAVLLLCLGAMMRYVHRDLRGDLRVLRGRVGRVEDSLLATDGGEDTDG